MILPWPILRPCVRARQSLSLKGLEARAGQSVTNGQYQVCGIEAPRHRDRIIEHKPAHGRPSSISSLIVRPPSVRPLLNSRMRAPAASARCLSKTGPVSGSKNRSARRMTSSAVHVRAALKPLVNQRFNFGPGDFDGHARPPCPYPTPASVPRQATRATQPCACQAGRWPPAPGPSSHPLPLFGYHTPILELTQEAGSEDPEASER